MNNFRNPYVDPYTFSGKIYDNYRNSTNPQSSHFSIDNYGGFEQREKQRSQKNNQYDKTKKQSIYTNHHLEKITDSKLVMFSPPKVDSIQKPLFEAPIDDLEVNIAQSKNVEKEKTDKKELVSALVEEFSLMLEDNPTIHEGNTNHQEDKDESNTFIISDESSTNDITADYLAHTTHENSEILFSEDNLVSEEKDTKFLSKSNNTVDADFLLMFLESDEENQDSHTNEEDINTLNETTDPMVDKYTTLLSENDELQEENLYIHMEIDALNETTDPMEEKYLTILSESDELTKKKQESNMNEEDFDGVTEATESIENEFITMLSESDEAQEEIQDSLFTDLKETKSNEVENLSDLKDTHFINYNEKKKTTTVKMQVLLAKLETDIDIIEAIDLLMPIENIVKVDWSIQSLDCKVVIPSNTVFLKGEFIADIEFSNKALENRNQSRKVSIPWSKTSNINWLTKPESSQKNLYEYMFQSPHVPNFNYHYKSYHEFTEPINSHVNQINFAWHQELNPDNDHLQISGFAQLTVNLLQGQYVELDCYSK